MKKYFYAKIKTIATKYFSLCQKRLLLFLRLQHHSELTTYNKKIKNYILNIYTSKPSALSEAENPYLAYKTVGGSVRRCAPI